MLKKDSSSILYNSTPLQQEAKFRRKTVTLQSVTAKIKDVCVLIYNELQ